VRGYADARIGVGLDVTGARFHGVVNLSHCHAAELYDYLVPATDPSGNSGTWTHASLILDAFEYGGFGQSEESWDIRAGIRWPRETTATYSPGPWDQLQRVYRNHGHDEEVTRPAIAKENDLIDRGSLPPFRKFGRRVLGWTIGFGYRPSRALVWAIAAVAALTFLVLTQRDNLHYVGKTAGSASVAAQPVSTPISPASGSSAPAPTADQREMDIGTSVLYAMDVFIPVADFKVMEDWKASGALEYERFIFVALGWTLITVWVAGFTRIVRT
jgi:hypothetical protein